MKVPVSENPPSELIVGGDHFEFIIPTTAGFEVNWQALQAFHEARSQMPSLALAKRRWHACQARIIASRHSAEAVCGFSWIAHCAAARTASESL